VSESSDAHYSQFKSSSRCNNNDSIIGNTNIITTRSQGCNQIANSREVKGIQSRDQIKNDNRIAWTMTGGRGGQENSDEQFMATPSIVVYFMLNIFIQKYFISTIYLGIISHKHHHHLSNLVFRNSNFQDILHLYSLLQEQRPRKPTLWEGGGGGGGTEVVQANLQLAPPR
ncbi:hypothetical protein ACJX0J_026275, partial [Zea mays]